MRLRQKLLKLGSPARVAVFAVLIGVCALSPSAYADDPKAVSEAPGDSQPVRTSAQPPAKFFTIKVLHDQWRSRKIGSRRGSRERCNSSRLAKVLEHCDRCTTCADAGFRSRHRAVWTVHVPRSRRFAIAQVAGAAITYY